MSQMPKISKKSIDKAKEMYTKMKYKYLKNFKMKTSKITLGLVYFFKYLVMLLYLI